MSFHRRRRRRPSAEARGYDAAHRAARKAYVEQYDPLDPCCLCLRPLGVDPARLHLDHDPVTGGYRGLAHARCNVRDGARRGAQMVRARRLEPMRHSRDW